MQSTDSDSWVGAEKVEDLLASEQSFANVQKHNLKKVQEHKERKSHHRSEASMEENPMAFQEHPSAAFSQVTEFDTRISVAAERETSVKKTRHSSANKEIFEVEQNPKMSAKSKGSKSNTSRRNISSRSKNSRSSEQSANNESQKPKKKYLGLNDDMPVKVITEDEWKGADANTAMPSSAARPAMKVFALSNGTYNEVPSLVELNSGGDILTNPMTRAEFGNDTPLQLAIMMQKGCQVVYTMCHGFLGGIALAYALLIFSIGTSSDDIGGFFQVNPRFATCVQTSFGFLLSVCLVSVLDRYDIGSWKGSSIRSIVESKSRLIGIVILVIYSSTLVLNTCTAPWDERLALPPYNNSFWFSPENAEREINCWTMLSLFRCTGAILGWIFVSLFPNKDLLHGGLNAIHGTSDGISLRENISRRSAQKY